MPPFWKNDVTWIAAVVQQRVHWDRENGGDRELMASMQGDFTPDAVWKIAGQYGVARNFPSRMREQFLSDLRVASETLGAASEAIWLDEFVSVTRQLAEKAKQAGSHDGSGRRSYRPLSGISKVLWHRHPDRAFIYDDQARKAVMESGLLAPFFDCIERWGGQPRTAKETEFLIFAAAYGRYFVGLHEPLRRLFQKWARDPRGAARVVDKLLWLVGAPERPEEDEERESARGRKAKMGRYKAIEALVAKATREDRSIAEGVMAAAATLSDGMGRCLNREA